MSTSPSADSPSAAPLRSARLAHGWSQAEAARALAALALDQGVPTASPASLKTQLSRWENGHAQPDPQYRDLFVELYGRSRGALGLEEEQHARAPAPSTGLRGRIAAAAAVDSDVIALWREHLAVSRALDAELGATAAAGPLRALVTTLHDTLRHRVTAAERRPVAGVLGEAAALAGAHDLDAEDPDAAWSHYRLAHSAAVEAGDVRCRETATAGLAAVLIEIGAPGAALDLLDEESADGPDAARLGTARGLAAAAAGDRDGALHAFTSARTAAGSVDLIRSTHRVEVELAEIDRWWGHALVDLGDDGAVGPLGRALDAEPPTVRARASVHADLALALADREPERAREHARTARDIAERIGSPRIAARLRSTPERPRG